VISERRVDKEISELGLISGTEESPDINTRIFWRAGRKYGKNNIDATSVGSAIALSIQSSGDLLAEELLKLLQRKSGELLALKSQIEFQKGNASEYELPEKPEASPAADSTSSSATATVSSTPVRSHDRRLGKAAEALARHQQLTQTLYNHQAKVQEYEEKRLAREKYLSNLQKLNENSLELENELEALPGIYAQKFQAIKDLGLVCWARLVDGFQVGRSRIKKPSGFTKKRREKSEKRYKEKCSTPLPRGVIDIPTPNVLKP